MMRQLLILILFPVFLVVGCQSAVWGQDIQDEIDAQNYSLGYRFGIDLQKYKLEFRPEILWHGFFTPIDEMKPQYDQGLMSDVLAKLDSYQDLSSVSGDEKQDRIEMQNYSLGYRLGTDFLLQNVTLRPQSLWSGIFDGYDNKEPQIPLEEMAAILEQIKDKSKQLAMKKQPPLRLKGQHFLSTNAKMKGVTVLKSGLQYRVLKSGAGKTPKPSDTVSVHYRSRTIEGFEFSNSYPLGIPTPKEFRVDQVLPGWSEALQLMKEGDKWELYIPSYLAYKDSGPMAGQTVICDLELLEILPESR